MLGLDIAYMYTKFDHSSFSRSGDINQSTNHEFNKRLTNRNHTIKIYTMVKNIQHVSCLVIPTT